jgi:O-antigen/teichoic acid export membrane protein
MSKLGTQTSSNQASPASVAKEDLSGQNRFGRNVAFAWGGYLVNVVAGFIMPRLISDHLGQVTLGIWDFAWSVVSYFGLLQLGLSGSVQRYVAKYRAAGDTKALSKSVSTIGLSLKVSGVLAMILTLVVSGWVIPQFHEKLGSQMESTRLVVAFLGLEVAFSIMLTVYGGILVGCHRWDANNLISATCYLIMTIGMVCAILEGGGLAALAAIHCVTMTAGELVRRRLARRICPEFTMDFRLATWEIWKEQAKFSLKSLIPRIADLLSNQSLALLLTYFLGPAMLAIYSRPRNLMRQGQTIAAKFGAILIPTASSLQAQADHIQLQATFLRSTLFISSLTMPAVGMLALFGDEIIHVWMGQAYIYAGLVPILAVGSFPSLVQEPVWSILTGMNAHGRVGIWKLGAAVCSAVFLGLGLFFFRWQLVAAALAFALPNLVVDGIVAPILACRILGISARTYYAKTYLRPLIGTLPFLCLIWIAKAAFPTMPAMGILLGALASVLLMAIYWSAFQVLKQKTSSSPRFAVAQWRKKISVRN